MPSSFFAEILNPRFDSPVNVDISRGGKVLIISDFHMGVGRRDDLVYNGNMLIEILENYYFKDDWILILNGDIEELQKFHMDNIQEQWAGLYRVFDHFNAVNHLYKTLGNHDETLVFERNYPYPLYNAVKINTGHIPIYVFHGHQSSRIYSRFNRLISLSIRYLLKPLGIRNISSGRSPHHRFYVEKQAYDFSLENNCISIIGHTHRTLFESLGRFDYIKFEIERLCRDYITASEAEKGYIAGEVSNLRVELGKLKRSERRDTLRQSLYGDDLPVPCLFNAGCAIGKHGINAIELDNTDPNRGIGLVYWFMEGRQMKFINRGWYKVESFGDTPYRRVLLNSDTLDYIKAKVELLGK
ncbi:MAG: serine/threonine protein phosphatase [Treponema sp.]|jgi:predicted phosphodiesterase|nr:serine/threonine protein phosphatase [Treponema sp.]